MFTLMVRHKTIGFRWYQAANLESLLERIQWDRNQPGLAYMAPALAVVQRIVANRPQGYLTGYGYNIGCQAFCPKVVNGEPEGGEMDFFDLHLDTGTGEYWEDYKKGREIIVEPGPDLFPRTGLYYAKTLYGDPIEGIQGVHSLEECERLLREYQLTVHNSMCGIDHEQVVRSHLKTVDPAKEKEHEKDTHPGRGDAEVHPLPSGADSAGLRNDSTQDSGAMCATGPEPGSSSAPDPNGGRQEGTGNG
jgi:hypothetical protein